MIQNRQELLHRINNLGYPDKDVALTLEEFFENNNYVESIGAVSYTHLRAHETVLDLVCRLLLEKKKHNITKTYIKEHTLQKKI